MTSQTGKNRRGLRRTVVSGVAGSAIAAGLMAGFGAPTALAEPAAPTTQADTPPEMTADQALAIIATDYDTGAGGGQLSQLIHQVLLLRAQGFKPSNANRAAITEALDKRPNQAPLIEALSETLLYQRKLQAQMQNAVPTQQPGFNMGTTPLPPGVQPDPGNPNNTGIGVIPGGSVTQPIG
jgi:hypothetical protein